MEQDSTSNLPVDQIGVTVNKGDTKPLFSNGKQVDWHIPKDLYRRLRELHAFALEKNKIQTPESEHLFALMMLDDAITRGEKIKVAYEKSQKIIVEPGDVRGGVII